MIVLLLVLSHIAALFIGAGIMMALVGIAEVRGISEVRRIMKAHTVKCQFSYSVLCIRGIIRDLTRWATIVIVVIFLFYHVVR